MFDAQESGNAFSLWIGLLLPPIAWALQMQINYVLVPFECYGGSRLPLFLVTVVALVITLAAGLVSFDGWRKRNQLLEEAADGVGSRVRFMFLLGMLTSAMFFVVIAAQGLATIVFHPCML